MDVAIYSVIDHSPVAIAIVVNLKIRWPSLSERSQVQSIYLLYIYLKIKKTLRGSRNSHVNLKKKSPPPLDFMNIQRSILKGLKIPTLI